MRSLEKFLTVVAFFIICFAVGKFISSSFLSGWITATIYIIGLDIILTRKS